MLDKSFGSPLITNDGVTIAKESIVAAGSVVCKDLAEPGCLYAGNPAKKVKKITTKRSSS